MVYSSGKSYYLRHDGRPSLSPDQAYWVTCQDTKRILQRISNYSIYAVEEELRNGYITLEGGHRVGVAGKAVLQDGNIKTLKYISSFNIRISREVAGSARKIIKYITSKTEIYHTLVLSSPKWEKQH